MQFALAVTVPILLLIGAGILSYRHISSGISSDASAQNGAEEDSRDSGADTAASEEPQSPEETERSEDTENEDDPEALTEATVDGWQGVQVEERPLAYDVPDDWVVESPGMSRGFEEEDPDAPFGYSPTVMKSGVATYGERDADCPGYPPLPGSVGTSAMGESTDTADSATALAQEWAASGYEDDSQIDLGDPVSFSASGLEGHDVTAEIEVASQECYPETAMVRVVSVTAPDADDVYNLIIYADTSGAAAPDTDFNQVVSSLRPSEGGDSS